MESPMEVIKRRKSVRTYEENKPVNKEEINRIQDLLNEEQIGPLGNPVRFRLLDLGQLSARQLRALGTYGLIRGARFYLLAAIPDGEGALEDCGYCMERIILEITALGLGTCWLSGTFRRSSFARQMELEENELLPAISPVGYPGEKKRMAEKLMKIGTRSEKRKPWSQLFISCDGLSPLTEKEAGPYAEPLEAVRLGPSSMNLQPWRIVRDPEGDFHLYLKGRRENQRTDNPLDSQRIDMGIAMCHLELVARHKKLEGSWKRLEGLLDSEPPMGNLEYVASWIEKT